MEDSSEDAQSAAPQSVAPHQGSFGQSSKVIQPIIHTGEDSGSVTVSRPAEPESPVSRPPSPPASSIYPTPTTPPPPPPTALVAAAAPEARPLEGDPERPLAVTEVYSTYGLEYILLFISLAAAAISLGSLLNGIVDLIANNSGGIISSLFDPYAEAALIVSFPIFAWLFLRLEAKEEIDASLLTDASRRRGIQIVLIVSFIVALGGVVGYVGSLLSKTVNSSTYSVGGSGFTTFLHAIIDLVLAGAIFGYYWYKLHRNSDQDQL